MSTNNDPVFARVSAANPEPNPQVDWDRANQDLRRITGGSQRGMMAAAAAVIAVIVFGGVVFATQDRATASEVLTQSAEAAAQQPDLGVTQRDYQRRVDTSDAGSIVTETRVDAAGTLDAQETKQGETAALERALDTKPQDEARELLVELLQPGLSPQREKELYLAIAELSDMELRDNDQVAVVDKQGDSLSMTFIPTTGQLVQVDNLFGEGITTRIDAAGVLSCVDTTASSPAELSLACADNNYYLTDLQWRDWGSDTATSDATAWINECDPSCADSQVMPHSAKVIADQRKLCGYNLELYTRIRVEYSDTIDEFAVGCAE